MYKCICFSFKFSIRSQTSGPHSRNTQSIMLGLLVSNSPTKSANITLIIIIHGILLN